MQISPTGDDIVRKLEQKEAFQDTVDPKGLNSDIYFVHCPRFYNVVALIVLGFTDSQTPKYHLCIF